jgi:hypothetical protein
MLYIIILYYYYYDVKVFTSFRGQSFADTRHKQNTHVFLMDWFILARFLIQTVTK